ncbi:hypothetical protein WR25_05105 [Diploscapter pachys]|uniref:Major facilitator superfamily (MFS) profile domain-containing protein n=1 Tax=Diploscapter pachys TaxID=2018661 RepID=A0A2A2J7N5_9BILA|nr:hypothetical protein WR25_05105 [Diploscapter pachys]
MFFASQMIYSIFSNYTPPKWKCGNDPETDNCEILLNCTETITFPDSQFHSMRQEMLWLCGNGEQFARFFSSSIFFGVLIGTISFGTLSDLIGRKPVAVGAMSLGIFANLILGFMPPNPYILIAIRFIIGIGIGGTLVVVCAFSMEMLLPQQRMALRAFFNWGRLEDMRASEKHIAKIAGIEYVPVQHKKIERSKSFCELLHTRSLFKRLLVLWVMWFVASICGYATDLYSNTITGDLYVNQILFSILIAVSKMVLVTVDTYFPNFNRRVLHQSAQLMAIICFAILSVMKIIQYEGIGLLIISLIGTVFIEYTWDACYLCAVESMETSCRASATGSCSLIARVGGILSPYVGLLTTYWSPAVYVTVVVLGTFNLIISYFFLIETKGVILDNVHVDDDEVNYNEETPMVEAEK